MLESAVDPLAPIEWISFGDAMRIAMATNPSTADCLRTILRRAKAGLVRSKIRRVMIDSIPFRRVVDNVEGAFFLEPFFTIVNDAFLQREPIGNVKEQDFELGDISYYFGEDERGSEVCLYGIKLCKSDVIETFAEYKELDLERREFQQKSPRLTSSLVDKNAHGRRPYPWWNDFWIEVCRQVHADVDWRSQSEARQHMIDWAMSAGHGEIKDETLIKPMRALFRALGWASY